MSASYSLAVLKKTIWVFYLSVALAFSQFVTSHVHVYAQDLHSSNHGNVEQVHFHHKSTNTNHANVTEVDLSQQDFLKIFLFGSLVVAIFVAIVLILSPQILIQPTWPPERRRFLSSWLFSLRPPLRAPPL